MKITKEYLTKLVIEAVNSSSTPAIEQIPCGKCGADTKEVGPAGSAVTISGVLQTSVRVSKRTSSKQWQPPDGKDSASGGPRTTLFCPNCAPVVWDQMLELGLV